MCQLLGMNGNTPTDIVFSFSGFAKRACEHADGFGIAFFEGAMACGCSSTASRPTTSPRGRADPAVPPSKSRRIIAHIRKATQGQVKLENCHPFQREAVGPRYWAFAHNGDPEDFHPNLHASFRPVGDTTTANALCWLMRELNKPPAARRWKSSLTRCASWCHHRPARHLQLHAQPRRGPRAHCSTKLSYLVRQHPFWRCPPQRPRHVGELRPAHHAQ